MREKYGLKGKGDVRKYESSGKCEKMRENMKWERNSALGFLLGAIATHTDTLSLSLSLFTPLCL